MSVLYVYPGGHRLPSKTRWGGKSPWAYWLWSQGIPAQVRGGTLRSGVYTDWIHIPGDGDDNDKLTRDLGMFLKRQWLDVEAVDVSQTEVYVLLSNLKDRQVIRDGVHGYEVGNRDLWEQAKAT